jgi:hypothetical protein
MAMISGGAGAASAFQPVTAGRHPPPSPSAGPQVDRPLGAGGREATELAPPATGARCRPEHRVEVAPITRSHLGEVRNGTIATSIAVVDLKSPPRGSALPGLIVPKLSCL